MSKYVGFRLGKVHESHVISEYYCGGCGYPVTDHDSFCPECGGAFRESDASDLEAENARLRKEVDFYFAQVTDNARRYQADLEAIQAENRKLRNLLDFALPIAMYAASTEEGDRIRELMREVEQ